MTNRQRGLGVLLLAVFVLFVLVYYGYDRATEVKKSSAKQSIAVVLAKVGKSDVPVYLPALGSVTPTASVTVMTQVSGQLLRVLFREGQTVKTGDLLAEIDSRPYQAQLEQYEGQLARDLALLANARLDLKRYQQLWQQDSVAKQVLDTQKALVDQYVGTVKLDQGLVDGTRVSLIYCKITSPVTGRIGLRLVDPGNIVQPTDTTGIAVINALDPITVIFTLAEDQIPKVMVEINAGKTLLTNAYDRAQTQLLSTGKLLTIDNQIDPSTGTVKLKAQFPNSRNQLFPNQFVNIKLLVDTLIQAIVVPTAAIQHGTKGDFVYLFYKNNSTVKMQPIVVGITFENATVITSGLTFGQEVVVEGVDKLTDGAAVKAASTKVAN